MSKRIKWRGPWKYDAHAWYLEGDDAENDLTNEVAVMVTIDGRAASRALASRIAKFLKESAHA